MPYLDKKWFRNEGNLTAQVFRSLIAPDLGREVNSVLGRHGWQGNKAAGVAVELTADNGGVARAQFFLRGRLSEQIGSVAATKIWEKADKTVMLAISFPPGDDFNFASGTLASEYLPGEEVKVVCSKDGEALLPANFGAHGIGDFCMRAVAYIDKSSNSAAGPKVKYTIMMYPATEEEMLERSDLAADVSWPGVKVLEGQAELAPQALPEGWGCPLLPVVVPGADPAAAPISVSGAELRFAIAKVMATARLPTPCASASSMAKKWNKLQQDPNSAEERMPSIVWPTPARPAAQEGKMLILIHKSRTGWVLLGGNG